MFKGIADYVSGEILNNLPEETVISTYEKSIQRFKQRKESETERFVVKTPYVVFDPMLDFEPDPQYGRFLWRYPSFSDRIAEDLFKPKIYEDNNVVISPVLGRYKGRFEAIIWCSSVYQLIDFRSIIINFFSGTDRIVYPKNIFGYIVLPDEMVAIDFYNPYKKYNYTLNWNNNKSPVYVVENINKTKRIFPFSFSPMIRFTGIDDGSAKYGGPSETEPSEYRLVLNCEWEAEIPIYFIASIFVQPDKMFSSDLMEGAPLKYSMTIGKEYEYRFILDEELKSTINSVLVRKYLERTKMYYKKDTLTEEEYNKILTEFVKFEKMYFYELSQNDYDKINDDSIEDKDIVITVPGETFSVVNDYLNIFLVTRHGFLSRDYHWKIDETGNIILNGFNFKNFEVGEKIWIFIYKIVENEE